MLRDMTIGQYLPGDSVIHNLDSRTKFLSSILFITLLFFCKNFYSLGICFAALLIYILLSKISIKYIYRAFKPVIMIVAITAIINLFFTNTGKVLFSWHFIKITDQGLFTALFYSIRIILIVLASVMLTYTTTPTMITYAIERLFSTKYTYKGVHTFAMMMTIALRFIPILTDEFIKITDAQKSRGASFDTGSLTKRIKALIPVLIPLFFTSFKRATDLAFAMECRCYKGAEGRTRYKITHFSKKDLFVFVGFVFTAILVFVSNKFLSSGSLSL
ncbi:MAG: energy-coupling factor transporter transmembrane component T [Clostridia bacterium]|nr:energy-coupling factor transporter transmembrane component T [Clostridia bacterium]